ncbi:MAG TPA: DUF167 family protein [Kiritimatiellia bacterium]|jgi:hypothetical protein|nr:DUF167 family protein [Kiritimatiellia bacterium]HOM59143.1 DUF167 family protein [Kiritimatiellia bacterium]HOR96936.1 DUF167 family protein [Kiritimatiellia bacterium]HPC49754.1 DUF167 family protein [Kiritimatiellia bacterium]HPK37428.1 DUF167 family protein [Kiritimatiellia bacterium]
MSWVVETRDGCVVTVKATPRANRSEIAGVDADWLRVRLQAPPVDGKANAALIAFLAKVAGVPKRSVVLLSGETSRLKRVALCGVTAAAARQAFAKQ